jgi:hypothetical protein
MCGGHVTWVVCHAGICAELGIPMTHRGIATSVRFLTGHAKDGDEQVGRCMCMPASIYTQQRWTSVRSHLACTGAPGLDHQGRSRPPHHASGLHGAAGAAHAVRCPGTARHAGGHASCGSGEVRAGPAALRARVAVQRKRPRPPFAWRGRAHRGGLGMPQARRLAAGRLHGL